MLHYPLGMFALALSRRRDSDGFEPSAAPDGAPWRAFFMLQISQAQMQVFEQLGWTQFEEEMLAHSAQFAPKLSRVLPVDQARKAIRGAIEQAVSHGLRNRGPVRLYVEMMYLFGSDFATDPQFPWAAAILRSTEPEMQRAERLYEQTLDYQARVSGSNAANTRRALSKLALLSRRSLAFSADTVSDTMYSALAQVFPEKARYVGDEALRLLVRQGIGAARAHELPAGRPEALVVALMFAFGHGCLHDPLYPWIENTLRDERIASGDARAQRLERKAVTWLDHVVASFADDKPAS